MLEADENEDQTVTLEESIEDKRELIQAYFEAVSILSFFFLSRISSLTSAV